MGCPRLEEEGEGAEECASSREREEGEETGDFGAQEESKSKALIQRTVFCFLKARATLFLSFLPMEGPAPSFRIIAKSGGKRRKGHRLLRGKRLTSPSFSPKNPIMKKGSAGGADRSFVMEEKRLILLLPRFLRGLA